jgi:hypothetical protein
VKHFYHYFLMLLLLASACGKDEYKPGDIGLDYFPLRKGNYQIFNVSEVIYSEVKDPENRNYQLKVEIVDSFPNTEGIYTYVLSRTRRDNASQAWQDVDTWSARGNDRELVVNEGNTAFVKITFPVGKGNEWNGNKLNNGVEDDYEMETVDEPAQIAGTTFEKTLRVVQENNEDLIVFQDKREEVYARGIGLVYKETVQLSYCTDPNCIGQQKIKSGIIYKQEINEYGAR